MHELKSRKWLVGCAGVLVAAFSTASQQPAPVPDNVNQGQPIAALNSPFAPDAGDQDQAPPSAAPAFAPINMEMRVLGEANPYHGFDSPLHWGHFSIDQVDTVGVQDRFEPGQGLPAQNLTLGLLSTRVAFSHAFRKTTLLLQYSPQAVIDQNHHIGYSPSSNNNLGFGINFNVTPRFTMIVKDEFTYNQTQQVFNQQILQIYRGAGGILPGDFLQNNGSYLSETFSLGFGYELTPRWKLSITPLARYIGIKDKTLNYNATGLDFIDQAALTYALSPHSTFSVGYNFEMGRTLTPRRENTYYHGLAAFYSYQPSPTVWIEANGGAEVMFVQAGATPPVFATGAFSVVKGISHATFAVNYVRDKELLNYIGQLLTERADGTVTLPWKRLTWTNGFGYFHEIGGVPTIQGKYAQTSVDLRLTKSVWATSNYTYRFQSAGNLGLDNGTHFTAIFGLRWAPPALLPQ